MFQTLRMICSIGLAVTVLSIAVPTLAAPKPKGWVPVMTDVNHRTWYVDRGSIQGQGPFRYFWSYIVGGSPVGQNGRLIYSSAYYLSVDCQKRLFRLRFITLLDENNQTIQEYNYGDQLPLGSVSGKSGEAASTRFVCSH